MDVCKLVPLVVKEAFSEWNDMLQCMLDKMTCTEACMLVIVVIVVVVVIDHKLLLCELEGGPRA